MRTSQFVESYFDAWNHGDPEGVAEHLTADGIYCDIPENSQTTQQELVTSLGEFFTCHRQRYELVGDILANANTIAFQYRTFPAGRNSRDKQNANGAEFMVLNGDAAMTISDYYEIPGMYRSTNLSSFAARNVRRSKYAKSGLNAELMCDYKARLENIMIADKAYLRPDLTLPRLAKAVGCSVNHLSQVINSGFGMSFFDYLNQHRIRHAKTLLGALEDANGAILNIAFTVGFNSNSAFYAAFKKYVGQTPAQYRRAQNGLSH